MVTIGRDPTNDVALGQDPKISRSHAEIQLRDGQRILADLASRNGTKVNDRSISIHPLCDGDRIHMGDTILIYLARTDPNVTEVDTNARLRGPELSDRERQVLTLVAEGLTDRDISENLSIGVSTVRSHLDRIKAKTGLRRRSELTRLAMELHIVD